MGFTTEDARPHNVQPSSLNATNLAMLRFQPPPSSETNANAVRPNEKFVYVHAGCLFWGYKSIVLPKNCNYWPNTRLHIYKYIYYIYIYYIERL